MKRIKKEFKKIVKNTKKKLKEVKEDHLVKKYFQSSVLFITYVIASVLNATILRFFCMHSIENFLSWKAILADTAVVVALGSFVYLFKPITFHQN